MKIFKFYIRPAEMGSHFTKLLCQACTTCLWYILQSLAGLMCDNPTWQKCSCLSKSVLHIYTLYAYLLSAGKQSDTLRHLLSLFTVQNTSTGACQKPSLLLKSHLRKLYVSDKDQFYVVFRSKVQNGSPYND